MTKYKAGDTIAFGMKLDADTAEVFNDCGRPVTFMGKKIDIISHEPAPEPIKIMFVVHENGYIMRKRIDGQYYLGSDEIGRFEITITGNDFTVEKVTE